MVSSSPDVDEVALDGGGGGHLRRHEVRAAAAALAALEVAVGGGGAALARRQDVGVHAQAHRAARAAPVEAGGAEDLVQALGLGLRFTCTEPGTTIAWTSPATLRPSTTAAAARRSPIREFVHEPMNTRSSAMSCIGVPASRSM